MQFKKRKFVHKPTRLSLFIFFKGRDARNKTMHSKGHQLTETDLKDFCDIFIEIVNLIGAFSKHNVKKIEKVT